MTKEAVIAELYAEIVGLQKKAENLRYDEVCARANREEILKISAKISAYRDAISKVERMRPDDG